jgi:hypothetical protein
MASMPFVASVIVPFPLISSFMISDKYSPIVQVYYHIHNASILLSLWLAAVNITPETG